MLVEASSDGRRVLTYEYDGGNRRKCAPSPKDSQHDGSIKRAAFSVREKRAVIKNLYKVLETTLVLYECTILYVQAV